MWAYHIAKTRDKGLGQQSANRLTLIIAISIGKPGGDKMLSGDGPDFKRKAPSVG